MRAPAILLLALCLPVADGVPERGTRKSERGTGQTNARVSVPRSAFRVPRFATLTIGRLHYDGGGDWYTGPSKLPNLLAARYLEQGGFLHADDDYGMDKSFRREIARVFPDHPLVEVPLNHPVYHVVYDFPKGIPKIHEHDGLPAQGFGIFLGDRLVVYYSYQSDLGDGWEDPEVHHDPPELHEAALRMGVNLFTYAVSALP